MCAVSQELARRARLLAVRVRVCVFAGGKTWRPGPGHTQPAAYWWRVAAQNSSRSFARPAHTLSSARRLQHTHRHTLASGSRPGRHAGKAGKARQGKARQGGHENRADRARQTVKHALEPRDRKRKPAEHNRSSRCRRLGPTLREVEPPTQEEVKRRRRRGLGETQTNNSIKHKHNQSSSSTSSSPAATSDLDILSLLLISV
ncbi:Hypothetical predicted protein [Olea europaea subsp. europaea]|uniref:Uncharacterized protein n=1 Tax=Olea europaea subsp. europaea TaxID=158383 RepID=A0A8S0TKY5_OLEEU|nr:Hypothetical predicted protein [Olea europaea subsp. europaea]